MSLQNVFVGVALTAATFSSGAYAEGTQKLCIGNECSVSSGGTQTYQNGKFSPHVNLLADPRAGEKKGQVFPQQKENPSKVDGNLLSIPLRR